MHAALSTKLRCYAPLSGIECRLLADASQRTIRTARPRRDIVREGDRPRTARLIVDGWAFRYKMLPDGRRQIVAVLLPGDLIDPGIVLLHAMDHSIGAATPVTYAEIARDDLDSLCAKCPAVRDALVRDALATVATQREWTVNLGQRTARERLAHLFCELFARLDAIGLAEGNRCEMPLTQADLGEATGLTSVHVNRTLQELRREGLIALEHRILTIPDRSALIEVAMFTPGYLHLDESPVAAAPALL